MVLSVEPSLWQATISSSSILTPIFENISSTCPSRRSFVMLGGIPAISMHSSREYYSILCKSLSRLIIFSEFLWWFLERNVDVFSATLTLLRSNLFSLFSLPIFLSMFCNFALISLFSFFVFICFKIKFSWTFIAKSISWLLDIISSCFLIKILLPAIVNINLFKFSFAKALEMRPSARYASGIGDFMQSLSSFEIS